MCLVLLGVGIFLEHPPQQIRIIILKKDPWKDSPRVFPSPLHQKQEEAIPTILQNQSRMARCGARCVALHQIHQALSVLSRVNSRGLASRCPPSPSL